MSRFMILICVLLQVMLIALPAQAADSARKDGIHDRWLVSIGIDKFQDKKIGDSSNVAALNAHNMVDFMTARGGYREDHVKLLLNEKATQRNILKTLADGWLTERLKPADMAVVYISTKCSPKELDSFGTTYLLAHDTSYSSLFATGISLKNFVQGLSSRIRCRCLVLIIESDFSGSAISSGRQRSNLSFSSQNWIMLCSSSANQKSWVTKDGEGSVFTNRLIDVVADGEIDDSLSLVFEKTKKKVEQEVRRDRSASQTPVMKSTWQGPMPSIQPPISE